MQQQKSVDLQTYSHIKSYKHIRGALKMQDRKMQDLKMEDLLGMRRAFVVRGR